MSERANPSKPCTILVIKGQGIGPECIDATKTVLAATGLPLTYVEGTLGYPDAVDLFSLLQQHAPGVYAQQFGSRAPSAVGIEMETAAKDQARAAGNINDFYKRLLGQLQPATQKAVKEIVTDLERATLQQASRADAVLKGALRTLDEGDEPSRNVTIRKGFEQYANIRRCVTLDPIAPGIPGADILFVRENVEDLYASIEHRLARNYPQALRHQTPEGCELICRAAFESAVRDGRKKVTALEKPNILKITGGLFKESFLKVARDYTKERLGDRAIEANFMIVDDGLAAIAANPEKFDVVVTSNMFGDIGSDIAAKVTGGVGLVSSNNTNPNNPEAVSMFETMGGTADDIAGQNKANPVALIDAAAEMLLHIGGAANIRGAELIKTAVLEVLADGHYVGDIKKGPYQAAKGKERSGTREFAGHIAAKITELRRLREAEPGRTLKQLALSRAEAAVRPLFDRVLRSYEQYAADMQAGAPQWAAFVERNVPPNPIRANSKMVGFDLFVDDSGLRTSFAPGGAIESATGLVPEVRELFERETGVDLRQLFDKSKAGSLQSIRSFGQYSARVMRDYLQAHPEQAKATFATALATMNTSAATKARFSQHLLEKTLQQAVSDLGAFAAVSIKLVQAFYRVRAGQIRPILQRHGFALLRITSRGTEIYPTMCDFEKRDVDRYRIAIDAHGPLAGHEFDYIRVQAAMMAVQTELVKLGWMVCETMLNRTFIDGEGDKLGKEVAGVSRPYAMNLGTDYSS
ncbi:MAG: isocitrate/isopropylmalate family dehydrogenase [Planctomycetes bacterium]|jgi:isocitrate/isopropylmalate dehydrogenase|nr:isocitrate/isopropylmalate family dehydrogenase [Planctomycetota bacterium]